MTRTVAAGVVAVGLVLAVAASCGRAPHEHGAAGDALGTAIAEVEAGRRTTPLVAQPRRGADVDVTFLVKSAGGEVPRIVSDVTGWGENVADDTFDIDAGTMTRVGSSDWYRLDTRVACGARIQYLTVQGRTDYRADPNNPRRAAFSGDEAVSEFVAPDYVPPEEPGAGAAAPAGAAVEAVIASRALDGPARVTVYTPPGYRRDGAYPVAVFHALWGVSEWGRIAATLDRLIAARAIPPLVAVFLESHRAGDRDLRGEAPMRTFLGHEVPAWLGARFGVTRSASERAILGVSFGAKDALDAAVEPAGAYRRLGLLIPGRRLRPADLAAAGRQPHRLRVAILAGRYDLANVATARAARTALAAAGDAVDYLEVPEGHNPSTWRTHLGEVLTRLFGTTVPAQ